MLIIELSNSYNNGAAQLTEIKIRCNINIKDIKQANLDTNVNV